MTDEADRSYKAETGDDDLDLLMALVFAATSAAARQEELRVPVLACLTEGGVVQVYQIAVVSTTVANVAHLILHDTRATHAVLGFEAWEVQREMTPEMRAAHAAGRPIREPGDRLPPSEDPGRYDVLMLLGEIKGRPPVGRRFRLDPLPEGGRALVPTPVSETAELGDARMNPLFRSPEEIRRLVRKEAELARWRDRVRSRRN